MKRHIVCAVIWMCVVSVCALAQGTSSVLPVNESEVLVSETGQLLTPPGEYSYIVRLDDGMFCACPRNDVETGMVLLDAQGQVIQKTRYEDMEMRDGVLFVMKNGLTGVVDKDLSQIVPCAYTQLVSNGEGGFLGITSPPYDDRPDGVYFIDGSGAETAAGARIMYGLSRFSEGRMPVMDGVSGRMGYLGTRGEWAIDAQYQYADRYANGRAVAAVSSGAGLIDEAGNWLLTPKYETIACGKNGLIVAQESNEKIELIDEKDFSPVQTYTGTDIYYAVGEDEDLAVMYLDDVSDVVDAQGRTLIECDSESVFDAWSAQGNRMLVRMGEQEVWLYDFGGSRIAGPWQDAWLLGETDGHMLYAVQSYDVYESVDADISWHTYETVEGTESVSVVDENGETVIGSGAYTSLFMDENGNICFETETEAGIMDAKGNILALFSAADAS